MTSYTAAGRSKHATLTANTVDVVTLDRPYRLVEIINRDTTADLWVTVDRGINDERATTPAIAADGTFYVGAGSVRILNDDEYAINQKPTTVRLISASAVAYSVTGGV